MVLTIAVAMVVVAAAVLVGGPSRAGLTGGRPVSRARRRLGAGAVGRRPVVDRLAGWLAPRLLDADLGWPPASVARGWLVAGAVVPVVAVTTGRGTAVLLGAAVGLGPPVLLRSRVGRRGRRVVQELPALLEAVARSLRTGATLRTALLDAARAPTPAGEELARVLVPLAAGVGLAEALAAWPQRRPSPSVRLAVGALLLADAVGGAPARAVDGVAATLRDRLEVEAEARALASQARTSALVVAVAPLVFAGLGAAGDERTAHFLLGTRAGLLCLVAGLGLDAAGAWWMARLTADTVAR